MIYLNLKIMTISLTTLIFIFIYIIWATRSLFYIIKYPKALFKNNNQIKDLITYENNCKHYTNIIKGKWDDYPLIGCDIFIIIHIILFIILFFYLIYLGSKINIVLW